MLGSLGPQRSSASFSQDVEEKPSPENGASALRCQPPFRLCGSAGHLSRRQTRQKSCDGAAAGDCPGHQLLICPRAERLQPDGALHRGILSAHFAQVEAVLPVNGHHGNAPRSRTHVDHGRGPDCVFWSRPIESAAEPALWPRYMDGSVRRDRWTGLICEGQHRCHRLRRRRGLVPTMSKESQYACLRE